MMVVFPHKTFFVAAAGNLMMITLIGPLFQSMCDKKLLLQAYLLIVVVTLVLVLFLLWCAFIWTKSAAFSRLFSRPGYNLLANVYFFVVAYFYNINVNYLSPSLQVAKRGSKSENEALTKAFPRLVFYLFTLTSANVVQRIELRLRTWFLHLVKASVITGEFSFTVKISNMLHVAGDNVLSTHYFIHGLVFIFAWFILFSNDAVEVITKMN